jgi:hypothetical protein
MELATPEMILETNSMVYSLMAEADYSFDDALGITEEMISRNPFMLLHAVPCIESDSLDIEDDPLFEAFFWAMSVTNGNEELLAEAMLYESPQAIAEAIGDVTVGKAANNAAAGIKASAQDTADKASETAGTITRGVRRFANNVKHNVVNPIAVRLHNMVKAISDANEEEKREMVISGSFFHKIRHLFKKILLFWWVRPAIFALIPGFGFSPLTPIIWLTKLVITTGMAVDIVEKGYKATVGDGNLAPKTRNRVIQELELELRMTREKIEDARGAGDREKKYALMRLENKIEQEISRIKYGASI